MNKITVPVPQFVVEPTAETEFKTYLQMIKNSVGSNMFRNLFVMRNDELFDASGDGQRSCAFFVSSILVIFKKIGSFHNTVYSTIKDLKEYGWEEVEDLKPGDVIIWEPILGENGAYSHIGFYIGDDVAVSASDKAGTPIEHHKHQTNWTDIARIYRLPEWKMGVHTPPPPLEGAEDL